ncbi:hypothetical protein MYX78_12345 [Acidobacteria bacterium AH-259-G07]|nr:hypothetical protein [Acidobacteria bacterium AH-259-G07]
MDFLVSPEATLKEVSLQSSFMRSVWEKSGEMVLSIVAGGRKGGMAKQGAREQKWENYQKVSDKVAREHPDWGRMRVARKTVRECNRALAALDLERIESKTVSLKTILRRTKFLKKK